MTLHQMAGSPWYSLCRYNSLDYVLTAIARLKRLVIHFSSPTAGVLHNLSVGTNDVNHGLEINALAIIGTAIVLSATEVMIATNAGGEAAELSGHFLTGSSDTTCKIWKGM